MDSFLVEINPLGNSDPGPRIEEGDMRVSAFVVVGRVRCFRVVEPVSTPARRRSTIRRPKNGRRRRICYGGCILKDPIGEVPDDLYTVTDIVPADDIPPFTKKLTVYGLTLAAGDDASDDFMRLVARAITEIFPRDDGLDLAKQEEVLRNHYLYKALIPVPVGEDMSFFEDEPGGLLPAGQPELHLRHHHAGCSGPGDGSRGAHPPLRQRHRSPLRLPGRVGNLQGLRDRGSR